ncbi:5-(carboxyamino)imidazole ribonucleotide synthase [Frigoriglobus tundricola]|uniref:N5-carboxyaminoimidazole ribonucleotide synthase n=1 Tax=Frigoriglobus tundricola TaxID=2774151 RepID=A0A6M5Z2S1_9BACT|nr:5-(carboxyamino)imidazole ribonucleotide synthase [Frigoriglobus tundricola]QJW99731.1 N5-carboxyaminoimidazole ribonucleotide synthase [Frigoriglobus tundricola]
MKLGILGGGQLGRMIALAGYPLGAASTVLEPAAGSSAAQVCGQIAGEFDDHRALYELAKVSDVVTFEFENVPVESARWLAERVPVYPPPRALEVSQERLAEKRFFQSLGIPTPPFAGIESEDDYRTAVIEIGLPAVLKTRRFGYDGKGQAVIRTPADADAAWQRLGGRPLILEGFVPFDRELSIIAVRGRNGQIVTYPLIENTHIDGILHRSIAPAPDLGEELTERAAEFASRVLTELEYVGVLTIEWFQDGPRLLANEMAPRVHNSGHWTIEGALTSQFENHARAVGGLPLGRTDAVGFSAMYNFIGTVPQAAAVLANPDAHLHLYGKSSRPGRKVGHVTLRAGSRSELEAKLPEWDSQFARTGEG